MAFPCADMECSLQVHADCESCLMMSQNTLRSIRGVYEVEWDRRENVFRVSGEVDPNILMKAVMRSGNHAELIKVKIKHQRLRYNNYRSYGPTVGNYMPPYYRDSYRSSSPSYPPPYYESNNNDRYYPYGMPHYARIDYGGPSYNTTYDHQNPLPSAPYVPSYPYHPYYNGASVDACSIM